MGAVNDHIAAAIATPTGAINDKLVAFFSANYIGSGSPENVVTAPVGSRYQDMDTGGTGTSYVKTSGTGNTGWVTVDTAGAASFPMTGTGAATTTDMVSLKVTGDTQQRLIIDADGTMNWGSGSAAQDASLSRTGVGILALTGVGFKVPTGTASAPGLFGPDAAYGIYFTATETRIASNGVTPVRFGNANVVFQVPVSFGAVNITTDTTTGTKIGTATSQKFSLWNATPIVQPTTAGAAATFVANTSLIANDTATFDGYTIGQVVKALRNIGALA